MADDQAMQKALGYVFGQENQANSRSYDVVYLAWKVDVGKPRYEISPDEAVWCSAR